MSPRCCLEGPGIDHDLIQLKSTRQCVQLVRDFGGVSHQGLGAKFIDHRALRVAVRIGGAVPTMLALL
jgi:hypothetical protein